MDMRIHKTIRMLFLVVFLFAFTLSSYASSAETLLNMIYPVGAVYKTVDASFNPATEWGGTWEKVTDRVLVGAGNTYSVNATGGSNSVSHVHGSDSSRNGTLSAAIGSTNSNPGALGFKHTNDLNVGMAGAAEGLSITGHKFGARLAQPVLM